MGDNKTNLELGTKLNSAIDILIYILKFVTASVTEAELRGLFNNGNTTASLWLSLEDMGWRQFTTKIIHENATTSDIANNTNK